jgi:uncharacterized RDD family membrane protein YckC
MAIRGRRLRDASGRLISAPARAVSASAGERLESELERAADAILAGPFPEALARSVIEHHVLERAVAQIAESGELDRMLSAAVNAEATERLVRQIAASPVIDRLLADVAASPKAVDVVEQFVRRPEFQQAIEDAVRAALAARAATFRDRLIARVRALDARLESGPRRWTRRSTASSATHAGLASRAAAFLIDVFAVHAAFLIGTAMVGLVLVLADANPSHGLEGALATAGWLAVAVAYFAGFWTTAGQTPGMAVFRTLVVDGGGEIPGFGRSLVRVAGGLVAVAFVFLGFLPVLVDDRRRALPDLVARTEVVYE